MELGQIFKPHPTFKARDAGQRERPDQEGGEPRSHQDVAVRMQPDREALGGARGPDARRLRRLCVGGQCGRAAQAAGPFEAVSPVARERPGDFEKEQVPPE